MAFTPNPSPSAVVISVATPCMPAPSLPFPSPAVATPCMAHPRSSPLNCSACAPCSGSCDGPPWTSTCAYCCLRLSLAPGIDCGRASGFLVAVPCAPSFSPSTGGAPHHHRCPARDPPLRHHSWPACDSGWSVLEAPSPLGHRLAASTRCRCLHQDVEGRCLGSPKPCMGPLEGEGESESVIVRSSHSILSQYPLSRVYSVNAASIPICHTKPPHAPGPPPCPFSLHRQGREAQLPHFQGCG